MNNRFKNNKWYQRNIKLIILILYVLIFSSISVLIVIKGFDIIKTKDINYISNSNVNYKVYLKENDYFDKPYLEQGGKYIASLIDNVNVDYKYILNSDENMSGIYSYKVVGKLVVTESGKDNVLWDNNYDLSNENKVNFQNQKTIEISDNISVNYDFFNEIVASFKRDYGVAIDANLIVKLNVDTNIKYDNDEFNIESEPYINIPLSEQTIDIDIVTSENDVNTKTVTYTKHPTLNYFLIAAGILFLIIYFTIGIIVLIRIIKLYKSRNKYEIFIRKIFSNYDQIIICSNKKPDINNANCINVFTFEELVDAQNEVHKPIIFYEEKKGKVSVFTLIDNKQVYKYTVKSSDLEK